MRDKKNSADQLLRHHYYEKGVHPDPKKKEDIKMLPTPESTTQLQEFLGIITYTGSFVPNLSQNTAILRELLKKDAEFQWTKMHQKAFELVKASIWKETTLAYFDRDKESIIQVDAPGRGLGSVLLQDKKPIAYASKSLTDAEKRYGNIEHELLVVVFGAERLHTYVYGKHFKIESDHKPLEMIQLKNLTAAPPRLQRMLLRIQNYTMMIEYRPGKELLLADGLSRLPNPRRKQEIDLDIIVNMVQFSNNKIQQLRSESKSDPSLSSLQDIIVNGWPKRRDEIPKQLRPYWSYHDELWVEDGVILKGERVLIPWSMQAYVYNEYTQGTRA